MPEPTVQLSYRERSVFAYIQKFHAERGYAPTIREIAESTGYKSTSLVVFYLSKLESAGLIERDPEIARGMRIVGMLK